MVLIMYRNGSAVAIDGRHRSIWQRLVWEYFNSPEWWPLKHNESMWMVPGYDYETALNTTRPPL